MSWICRRRLILPFATAFRLRAAGDGTRLEFVHVGLEPRLECYDRCEDGWDFYFRRSLASLVATGRGLPWSSG